MFQATSSRTAIALMTLMCVFAPVAGAFACSCLAAGAPAAGCCAHPAGCPCCANPTRDDSRICAAACNAPTLVCAVVAPATAAPAADAFPTATAGPALDLLPTQRPPDRHGTPRPGAASDPPLYLRTHALLR